MSRWRLSRDTTDAFEEFQAFHAGLVELRRRAERGALVPDGDNDIRPMSPRDIFVEVHGHLTDLGYGRRKEARGDRLAEVDRGYVLASFADEMFLHMAEWDGRSSWSTMLIESALYGSRIAGERVFDAADRILARQEVGKRDLAMTILLALLLGFRGRYRRARDTKRLADYREQLFEFIFQRPRPSTLDWRAFLGQAYDHTLSTGPRRGLPSARPWIAGLIAVVLLYIVASHLQWMSQRSAVNQRALEILSARDPSSGQR